LLKRLIGARQLRGNASSSITDDKHGRKRRHAVDEHFGLNEIGTFDVRAKMAQAANLFDRCFVTPNSIRELGGSRAARIQITIYSLRSALRALIRRRNFLHEQWRIALGIDATARMRVD
jgi:hypothetical protein